MWKAAAGHKVNVKAEAEPDDDWETDPDFVNDVTEEEQRWGSKTVEGSGRTAGAINIQELQNQVKLEHAQKKNEELEKGPKASLGYGGKFGLQNDRMDKSAMGWDFQQKAEKHASQKDYSVGFGGKFGVQSERVDRSALGWDHKEKVEKHSSQLDYSKGFGGKYGVEKDRKDTSALGWDHHEKLQKHESQKDYSKGFGGKFGVQTDRKDASAHGWEEVTKTEPHPSQKDMKKGFGGQFGIQEDRQDKSAHSYKQVEKPSFSSTKPKVEAVEKASSLRARFENLAKNEEAESKRRAEEERQRRQAREERERQQEQKRLAQTVPEPEPLEPKVPEPQVYSELDEESPEETAYAAAVSVTVDSPQRSSNEAPQYEQPSPEVQTGPIRVISPEATPSPESQPESPSKSAQEEMNEVQLEDDPTYETLEETKETGASAIALYDYQASDYDEISFDPDDIITNIQMIDEGWWRGECKGQVGLFPANYVQLTGV